MPQDLVAIHLPDNFCPVPRGRIGGPRYRRAQRKDDFLPVSGSSLADCTRQAARNRRGRSAMATCFTDGPYLETKRSASAVFGWSKPLIWTRRWHGGARSSSPVACRSRCVRFNVASDDQADRRNV